MNKCIILYVLLSLMASLSCSQQAANIQEGNWIGEWPDKSAFSFDINISDRDDDQYHVVISNGKVLIDQTVTSASTKSIELQLAEYLRIDLEFNQKANALEGFIKSGKFFYRIIIPQVEKGRYSGKWHPFMLDDDLITDDLLLYVEYTDDDMMMAFPIFGEYRFRGTWASGFERSGNHLHFKDDNTGFRFHAELSDDEILLGMYLVDGLIAQIALTYSEEYWEASIDPVPEDQSVSQPTQLGDGWETTDISEVGIKSDALLSMIDSIQSGALVNTHSVLIAKQGKLAFESNFGGFNANIPHDQRSASKSISSAMIGIAIDDGFIDGVDQKLYDCLPESYQYTKDDRKAQITIKDLITMSGGMDVNDRAAENTYQDPRSTTPWLQTVLEAPMIHDPGSYTDYGSANPFLLGVCLSESIDVPVEDYMHEKLFKPLGISNYINQTDDTAINPYFGGGMMITPRDMLKFGQLYLNKGTWNGTRIISEQWVSESFEKHAQLQDVGDKNHYGYQWWHDTYVVQEQEVRTIEARGAGGQFIFIIPQLDAVVVVTSGNFRNRMGNQPRDILVDYILPSML